MSNREGLTEGQVKLLDFVEKSGEEGAGWRDVIAENDRLENSVKDHDELVRRGLIKGITGNRYVLAEFFREENE